MSQDEGRLRTHAFRIETAVLVSEFAQRQFRHVVLEKHHEPAHRAQQRELVRLGRQRQMNPTHCLANCASFCESRWTSNGSFRMYCANRSICSSMAFSEMDETFDVL